jgi:hypothetical protein
LRIQNKIIDLDNYITRVSVLQNALLAFFNLRAEWTGVVKFGQPEVKIEKVQKPLNSGDWTTFDTVKIGDVIGGVEIVNEEQIAILADLPLKLKHAKRCTVGL